MKWEMVKLGDVCEIIAGQSPPSDTYNTEGQGLPFFQGKTDFGILHPNIRMFCNNPNKIAEPRDILLSVRAPVGPTNISNVKCCIGRGLAAIRSISQTLPEFLFYFFKSIEPKLSNQGNGSTFAAITIGDVKSLLIPLPPLPVQRAIADRLDRADALRQKDRQLLRAYDDLAQSVFVEMFGDPVRNEKGWEVKTINDVATTRLGKMLDAKKQSGNHMAKYLGNSNVHWFSFDFENLKEMDFSLEERAILELKAGDVLMCEGGEIGRCAVWENNKSGIYYQKAIHRIRVNKEFLEPIYFVRLMYFFAKYGGFKDYVNSVTIAHLTGEKLRSMKIPVPPLPLQTRFATILANIERQKDLVRRQQVQSEALFGRLLQEAFEN